MQGISSTGPRKLKERSCLECGTVFQPATSTNEHCPPCQVERTRKLKAEAYRRRRDGANQRFCVDCGVELPPYRGRPSERCMPCQAAFRKAEDQKRNKERTESGERRVYDVRYRKGNNETIRANNRKYKAAHPETDLAAIHRRRQRRDHGMDDVDRLLSNAYRIAIRYDPCFYCGAAETQEDDHFFPLSKGGTDHWWNLVRTCKPCNRTKRDTCGTAFMLRGWLPPAPVAGPPVQRMTTPDREPLRLF